MIGEATVLGFPSVIRVELHLEPESRTSSHESGSAERQVFEFQNWARIGGETLTFLTVSSMAVASGVRRGG